MKITELKKCEPSKACLCFVGPQNTTKTLTKYRNLEIAFLR